MRSHLLAIVQHLSALWFLATTRVPGLPWLQRNAFIAHLREQQHFTDCEDCKARLDEMIGWYCVDLKPWMNYHCVRAQLHEVWGPVHLEEI